MKIVVLKLRLLRVMEWYKKLPLTGIILQNLEMEITRMDFHNIINSINKKNSKNSASQSCKNKKKKMLKDSKFFKIF